MDSFYSYRSDVMTQKRPQGELCKIQFDKTITVVGKVSFDSVTDKYHVEGVDVRNGKKINSWIDADNVSLIEDANQRETKRYEEDRSRLR